MEATNSKIKDFFDGKKQHIIPIHQRKYSWRKNIECKQLFEDILKIGRTAPVKDKKTGKIEEIDYYVGAFVFKDVTEFQITKRVVEDGQQRITSITLLVLAMIDRMKNQPKACTIKGINDVEELIETYIINKYAKGDEYYKLILNDSDKNDLKDLINQVLSDKKITAKMISSHKTSRIFSNFGFFRGKINKNNINDLYKGLLKLQIIEMSLQRYDIDQVIYETLNSTGMSLSTVDRVRNYLLMGLDPEEQNELYEHYWRSMEILFEEINPTYFDKFIRYYCILKLEKGIKTTDVYRDFKKLTNNFKDSKDVVKELFHYSEFFMNMFFGNEKDEDLKIVFDDFNNSNPIEFAPFLLKVYAAYYDNEISKSELIKTIKILESYLMRRGLCGLSGNQGSDGAVARMVRNVDIGHIVISLTTFLLDIKGNLRFLDDNYVKTILKDKNFCLFRRNKYVLEKLANQGRKTLLDLSNVSLVQIRMDDSIDEVYLDKIGNLTLEEIDLCMDIDADSNEEFIDKRTELLTDLILKVWEYPTL